MARKKIYIISAVLFLLNLPLVNFDKPFSDWFHLAMVPWDFWLQKITYAGDGYVLAVLLIFLTTTLFLTGNRWWKTSGLALCSLALCALPTLLLKFTFGRPRPYVAGDTRIHGVDFTKFYWFEPNNDFRSLPSGHSAAIFAVAWLIVRHRNIHWIIRGLTIASAFVVCLSRVALAKHFFTDAAAGALVGVVASEAIMDLSSHLHFPGRLGMEL